MWVSWPTCSKSLEWYLTQGPCPEGELFIMEFNSRDMVKPTCVSNAIGLRQETSEYLDMMSNL